MSMGLIALILFAGFIFLIILGVPIGFSLGMSGIIGLLFIDQPFMMFSQTLITGIDNFALLAIPFFVLLGAVMEKAEISRSLVDLADELIGFLRGGMAIVTVLASMLFATVSGSGPATVAAIGSITIPEMTKRGYSQRFAVGIASAAGAL
ncbi:MAG: TRAP transporter large permease subunit, partial [Deltaproteobacteria bacterium]|nr:TRAP transporter large permease subunit [Deltaproteobacteria bacterium]